MSSLAEQLEDIVEYMSDSLSSVNKVRTGYTPVGTIIAVMGNSAPAHYLACNGQVVNIATYPELADYFEEQFGSKNKFGGDGTTTFGIPDLRGEFLRGTGTNGHTNQGNGANVGVHQDASELPNIYGATSEDTKGMIGASFPYDIAPNSSVGALKKDSEIKSSDYGKYISGNYLELKQSGSNKMMGYTTRPTNTSVLYCIATKNIYVDVDPDSLEDYYTKSEVDTIANEDKLTANVYYYVDADNGDDTNDGLSTTSAFRTIQKAVNCCRSECYVGEDVNQIYYSYIRVNTSATNHYEPFRAEAKVLQLWAWNFNTDTSAETTSTLYIEPPSSWTTASVAIFIRKSYFVFRVANINVINTLGTGVDIALGSYVDFGNSTPSFTMNLTINSKSNGLNVSSNSVVTFRGTVSTDSSVNINSSNGWGMNISDSRFSVNGNLSVTGGGSVGGILIDNKGTVTLNASGASSTKITNLNITSNGTNAALSVGNHGLFRAYHTYTNVNIANNTASTTSAVIAQVGGLVALRSYNFMKIENKSTVANVHAVQSGFSGRVNLYVGINGTSTALFKNPSTSTGWCIDTYDGGVIIINGGTGGTYPILEGLNGILAASGGTVTYANIKNNCTGTKQSATGGGRIYTGNQTSIGAY